MFQQIRAHMHNEEGATAVEYGIMVAAIAAVIITVVFVLGGYVQGAFDDTCQALEDGGTTQANPGAEC